MQYSFSKLTSFYECPYAFYRNYQKKEIGIDNQFASYGILVHSILERYAKGELNLNQLVDEFNSGFEMSISEPIVMFGRDLTQSYFDKGVEFFSNFKGFWGLLPLEAEYKFETKLNDDNSLIGIIDLVARDDNDNLIIIDHKSSSKFSKKELKEKVRQLYLYSKAIKEKYGKFPAEVWFNHFKSNHVEKLKFSEDDYNEALSWALETINKIESCIDFEPNNTDKFMCDYLCDYRENCDYK